MRRPGDGAARMESSTGYVRIVRSSYTAREKRFQPVVRVGAGAMCWGRRHPGETSP